MAEPQLSSKYPSASREFAQQIGISDEEWKNLLEGFGRTPNEIECRTVAKVWSDECSKKSSRMFLRTVFREGLNVLRPAGQERGCVGIGFGEAVALRFEHDNIEARGDPALGAKSCLALVTEDLMSAGVENIAVLNLMRFGHAESTSSQLNFQRSAAAVAEFCNSAGFPVVGGELYFHPRYEGTSLINCAAVGITEETEVLRNPSAKPQDMLLYAGPKTARDGLAGASGRRPKRCDPYLAQLLTRHLSALQKSGKITGVESTGSGGLAKSLFNICNRIHHGLRIYCDQIPADGLQADELLFSETCERFLMIASNADYRQISDIFAEAGLSIAYIGDVLPGSEVELFWQHQLIAQIPSGVVAAKFEEKSYQLSRFPPMLKRAGDQSAKRPVARARRSEDRLDDIWLDLLADPNLCSKQNLYSAFDSHAGGNTVIGPGGDAALVRIRHRDGSKRPQRALALTMQSNSLYCSQDPYLGGVHTVAEAMRNVTAVGAAPIAAAQCMNFGDPDDYKQISEFAESLRGITDACRAWDIPILADAVSFRNGSPLAPVLPTPSLLMVGIVSDVQKSCSIGFTGRGDRILLLGKTRAELLCSEYLAYTEGAVQSPAPDIDFLKEKRTCDLVSDLIHSNLLHSAHDLSAGGLAIALTECCLARSRPIGAILQANQQDITAEELFFSETAGRFLVSCATEHAEEVLARCEDAGIAVTAEGTVGGKEIIIETGRSYAIPLSTAHQIWTTGLNHIMESRPEAAQG